MLGLRLDWLGTEALTWFDLLVIVKHQPTTSALARAMRGKAGGWDLEHYIALAQLNVLQALSWQQSGKGPKPKPILPPGESDKDEKTYKTSTMSIEELNRRLGWG